MMDLENVLTKLGELDQKIDSLEKSLQNKSNPSIIIKMDVKDLHLHELNLEELAFHLDKLDIKELSGMLNLGNTFSPKVERKLKANHSSTKEPPQQEEQETKTTDEIKVNVNGKSVSYTIG